MNRVFTSMIILFFSFSEAIDPNISAIINETIEGGLCRNHLNGYLVALEERYYWALRMFDASSKLHPGILAGHLEDYGDFDECLSVRSESLNLAGKYCMGTVSITTSTIYENGTSSVLDDVENLVWSICMPNSCTAEDASKLLPSIASAYAGIENSTFTFSERECQESAHKDLSAAAIVVISFLALFGAIALCSTCYHLYIKYIKQKEDTASEIFLAYSVLRSGKQLFFNQRTDDMSCLHGIRVFSFLWVGLFHNFTARTYSKALPKYLAEWIVQWDSRIPIAGRLGVDTFLTIGGLLVSYNFIKSRNRGEPFNIIKYYVHRIVRIWPSMTAGIIFTTFVGEYFVTGPKYPSFVAGVRDSCYVTWYWAVLFVQNCLPGSLFSHLCLAHLYYLNIDMHLYLISPILLFPLIRWPKIGIVWTLLFIIASMASTFSASWENHFTFLFLADVPNFRSSYYYRTYTRASPWLIGLLCGFLLEKLKKTTFKLQRTLVILLWVVSIVVMLTVVFYPAAIQGYDYRWETALYLALALPAWSVCVCWVVIACVFGYGGAINGFLSLSTFKFFGKLSYSWYIWHVVVIYIVRTNEREHFIPTIPHQIYLYFGELIISIVPTIISMFIFEYPPMALEKLLWKKKKTETINGKHLN